MVKYTELEKNKARHKVHKALISGRLKKPNYCQNCYIYDSLDGHHNDYSQPLNVVWLCKDCHNDFHYMFKKYPEVLNVYNKAVEIAKQITNKTTSLPRHKKNNKNINRGKLKSRGVLEQSRGVQL